MILLSPPGGIAGQGRAGQGITMVVVDTQLVCSDCLCGGNIKLALDVGLPGVVTIEHIPRLFTEVTSGLYTNYIPMHAIALLPYILICESNKANRIPVYVFMESTSQ